MSGPFTALLFKARKFKMKYKTGQKPPSGYIAVEGSTSGGYKKKFGGQWRYWYPWKYSKRVAQHGEYIGAEEHMHVGSMYEFSFKDGGETKRTHLEVIAMDGDRVRVKNTESGSEKTLTKKNLSKLLQDHHAADISSHQEFLKRKVAQAVQTGTTKVKEKWFDEAKRYGVYYDGDLDLSSYNAKTPPSNISLMKHEDIAPRITKQVPFEVSNFTNPNEEEGYFKLFRHQEEGISRILQSWDERDGFVLQDEAGLGKTLTALGAMMARGGKRNLVVVPTRGGKGLKGQWQESGDLYNLHFKNPKEGGDGYFVAAYNELFTKEEGPDGEKIFHLKPEYEGKFDTIVFDESHNMANPKSGESQGAVLLQDKADKVLYMSATPYTNIRDMHYLRKMGWFKNGGEFVDWAENLGASISRRGKVAGAIPFDVKNPRSALPAVAVAALLHASGAGAKRIPNYAAITNRKGETLNLNVNFGNVKSGELNEGFQQTLAAADKVKKLAIDAGLNPLTTGGRMFGWKRIAWEAAKADKAVNEAKRKLDADPNAQVLLFTDYTKFTNRPIRGIAESIRYRVNETKTLPESSLKYADEIDKIADTMVERDTLNYITQKLGSHIAGKELSVEEARDYVAQVHGGADAKLETADYQSGRKRAIVGTMKKGGTGLSYHDRTGGRPRTQINLSLPLSGTDFQQVSGRSYRMGSQTDVDMIWMHGDDAFEKHAGTLVGKKLANMGALVEGDPGANVTTGELLSWENAQSVDPNEVTEAIEVVETSKEPQGVAEAKDFFRESVVGLQEGGDILSAVGVRVAGSREKTRDFRARVAVAQLGAVGVGVSKTGQGLVLRGAEDGSYAHDVLSEMYYAPSKTKVKRAQIGTYNKNNGTWLVRDPADARKIAKRLGVDKKKMSAVEGWDDASLAMAVTSRPAHHAPEANDQGPFSELLTEARKETSKPRTAKETIKLKVQPRVMDEFQALEIDTYEYDPTDPNNPRFPRDLEKEGFIEAARSGQWTKEALHYSLTESGPVDNALDIVNLHLEDPKSLSKEDLKEYRLVRNGLKSFKRKAEERLIEMGGELPKFRSHAAYAF
jgi:hypothetical protein